MQHDEVIWQVIRHNHCSFMAKIETGIFCRNPYNVTGICNRSSCPLANSRYATIREHDGVFYLYMKTIERAHMPNKLWERVKLPANYEKALGVIDKHMAYWPKFLVHKIKQRLTKMTQMRIRMRKLALKTREKIMSTPRKEKKREARKLEKAETAARLEEKIEAELLERLKKGVYGGIYNYPVDVYNQALDKTVVTETEDDENPEIEYVVADDELETEMEDDMEDFQLPAVLKGHSDDGVDNDDEEVDIGDKRKLRKISNTRKHGKDETNTGSKKKAKVVIEVEHEGDGETQRTLV